MTKISWIEIQGFRAFGSELQRLEFTSPLSVIWGPNSQGKTSLAEAFEFLLTGDIARRQILSSAQDEFAEALRNVHIPTKSEVFVAAEVLDEAEAPHCVKRVLKADFGKKKPCVSILEIDGIPANQETLSELGIALAQPPLSTPILMQHTLGYLFSAKPQERSLYFKALLEVTDLEELRNTVSALNVSFDISNYAFVTKLHRCSIMPELQSALGPLLNSAPKPRSISSAFASAASNLLASVGEAAPPLPDERFVLLQKILQERRAKTFPLDCFNKHALAAWDPPGASMWEVLGAFAEHLSKIEEHTRQLMALFAELVKIPTIADATVAVDCPVCETPTALTPGRIHEIRRSLKSSEKFQQVQAQGQSALRRMEESLNTLEQNVEAACPRFLTLDSSARRSIGFTASSIRSLMGKESDLITANWIKEERALARARRAVKKCISSARTMVSGYINNPTSIKDSSKLRETFELLTKAKGDFASSLSSYIAAEVPLSKKMQAAVDEKSQTEGWQDFLELVDDQPSLQSELIDFETRKSVQKELEKALRQIDKAKEQVLEDKFDVLSTDIQEWWNLLRPGESTFFAGVLPRSGAVRTIDFKAALALNDDRKDIKLRDVVAVFSHSQMQCLGLAAFLARAVRQRAGFLILDDPILSSDEDHRAHFIHSAIERLLDSDFQVIILTQDQGTSKDLEERYAHRNINVFQISLDTPVTGATVCKTSDALAVKLARAKPFLRSAQPDLRKAAAERLRDAAERFCKEILVKNRRANGDAVASLTDYDGKNLGNLIPEIEPLLTDPAHPGKLRSIARTLNPGNHDDQIPNVGDLQVAYGDLIRFKKDYLETRMSPFVR